MVNKSLLENVIDIYYDTYKFLQGSTNYYISDLVASVILVLIIIPVLVALYYVMGDISNAVAISFIALIFFDIFSIITIRTHSRYYYNLFESNAFPINNPNNRRIINALNRNASIKQPYKLELRSFGLNITTSLPSFVGTIFSIPGLIASALVLLLGILNFYALFKFLFSMIQNTDLHLLLLIAGSLASSDLKNFAIAYLFVIFFTISLFIIGSVFAICTESIITMLFIVTKTPLKIDLMDEMGGTELYGKIILRNIYLSALVSLIMPIIQLLNDAFKPGQDLRNFNITNTLANLSIDNIFKGIINSTIRSPNLFIIVVYLLIFIFFVGLSLLSIIAIHEQLKNNKQRELDKISSLIQLNNYNTASAYSERVQYLLLIYDRISSINEWPVKLDFLLYAIISVLIPVLTLYFQMHPT
jgi:hypothetical protein